MSGTADPVRLLPTRDWSKGEKNGDVCMQLVNLDSFSCIIACSISVLVMHSWRTGGTLGSVEGTVCQIFITLPEEDFFVTLEIRLQD